MFKNKGNRAGFPFQVLSVSFFFGNCNKRLFTKYDVNNAINRIANVNVVVNNIICHTVHKSKCSTEIFLFQIDAQMYLWTTTCVVGWYCTRALLPFQWVQNNQIRTLCMQYSSSCIGLLSRVKLKRKRIFFRILHQSNFLKNNIFQVGYFPFTKVLFCKKSKVI